MNRRVEFRPQAAAEAVEVREWYEGWRAGLGGRFATALTEAIERIAANPLLYLRVRGETRRAVLTRFSYAVYFRESGNDVVVLAVHGRQHPRRWQSRS